MTIAADNHNIARKLPANVRLAGRQCERASIADLRTNLYSTIVKHIMRLDFYSMTGRVSQSSWHGSHVSLMELSLVTALLM